MQGLLRLLWRRAISILDHETPLLIKGDFNSSIKQGLKIANDGRHTRDENQILISPDITFFRNIPNLQWNVDHIIRLNSDNLPIFITLPERDNNEVRTMWDMKNMDLNSYKTCWNSNFESFSNESQQLSPHETAELLSLKFLFSAEQ